jgi:hypothetical protein
MQAQFRRRRTEGKRPGVIVRTGREFSGGAYQMQSNRLKRSLLLHHRRNTGRCKEA